MRRLGGSASQVIGIRDAGVRKNFYRRDRPATGETIYDIEWSLQQAETAALFRSLPASRGDGHSISKTKARSASSSPSSIYGVPHFGGGTRDRLLRCSTRCAQSCRDLEAASGRTHAEVIEELETQLTSDTYRLTKMLMLVRSVGIVSRFDALVTWSNSIGGRLVTSRTIPLLCGLCANRRPGRPSRNELDAGVIDTREVFVPVGPAHLFFDGIA